MNKFFNLVLVLLCLWVPGKAQIVEDTISLDAMITRAMSELDFIPVQSGIMLDKVPRYVDYQYLKYKQGVPPDSVYLPGPAFPLLYGMIDRSHTGTSPLVNIENWWDTFEEHEENDSLKLGLMWYSYDRLRADALDENLLSFSVDRFYDVPQRPEHPYVTDTLFAPAIMRFKVSGSQQLIHYDPSLYFSNVLGSPPALELDLGDGQGWQSIQPGGTISLSLSQDSLHLIRVRLLNSTGGDWYGNAAVWKEAGVSSFGEDEPHGSSRTNGEYNPEPDTAITLESGGTLFVFYNQSCEEPKLRKPLILIEGFDPSNSNDWSLVLGLQNESLLEQLYSDPDSTFLKDYIHSGHYDLIYVDFADGSASIIDNAQFVKDVIREVNSLKDENGSSEKNIIIGASMGGVVGKWALREMELDEEDHETEMYITFDSPMRGANIPLGIQAFLRDMNRVSILGIKPSRLKPAAKAGWETVNSPAAKQMLYYHIDGCNGNSNCDLGDISSQHAAFYNQFLGMGDLEIPEYAIINGAINGSASEEYNSGASMLDQNVTNLWYLNLGPINTVALDVNIWALPGGGSSDKVYHRDLYQFFLGIPFYAYTYCKVVNGTPLNYDNAPGGLREFNTGTDEDIDWEFNAFTFIPTISALSLDVTDPFYTGIDLTDFQTITDNLTTLRSYIGSSSTSTQNGITRVNQNHVSLDMFAAPYLLSLITKSEDLAVSGGVMSSQYNFGQAEQVSNNGFPFLFQTPNVIDQNVTVSGSSQLFVNRNTKVGDLSLSSNPQNDPNTTISITIGKSRCDGEGVVVDVLNGGLIHVGEDDPAWGHNIGKVIVSDESELNIGNNGQSQLEKESKLIVKDGGKLNLLNGGFLDAKWGSQVVLEEGSEMLVESGATLRISQYSSLIIEEGAALTIEDGAIIQLWDGSGPGGNAKIEVKGTLTVGEYFNFSGNGFFDMYSTHSLSFTSNKFSLVGDGMGHRIFRLNDGTYLNISNITFILDDGLVEFMDASSINLENSAKALFTNVTFETQAQSISAIQGYGYQAFESKNCLFANFDQGIILESPNSTHYTHTRITNCDFKSNRSSIILVEMDQAYITNSHIDGYNIGQSNGVEFQNIDQLSITTSTITRTEYGIRSYTGNEITRVVIHNSTINANVYGVYNDDVQSKVNIVAQDRTVFEDNTIAIYIEQGALDNNGLDYGLVKLDCISLINNDIGVLGKDLLMVIDAYSNSKQTGPGYALRSNTFRCGTGQVIFDLCYENRLVNSSNKISARGNFWDHIPTTPYIIRSTGYPCSSAGSAFQSEGNINRSLEVTSEPENCGALIADPDFEENLEIGCKIYDEYQTMLLDLRALYKDFESDWRNETSNEKYDLNDDWFSMATTIAQYDPFDTTLSHACHLYIQEGRTFSHTSTSSYGLSDDYVQLPTHHSFKDDLDIFPIPFENELYVRLQEADNSVITVLDMLGAIVHESSSDGFSIIDTHSWRPGVYILMITDEKGQVKSSPIIKQGN